MKQFAWVLLLSVPAWADTSVTVTGTPRAAYEKSSNLDGNPVELNAECESQLDAAQKKVEAANATILVRLKCATDTLRGSKQTTVGSFTFIK